MATDQMSAVNPITNGKFSRVFPFENSRFEELVIVRCDRKMLFKQIIHRYERRAAALKSFVYRSPPFFVDKLNRKPALPEFVALVVCDHSACRQLANLESRVFGSG